jgi:hypothetical protein
MEEYRTRRTVFEKESAFRVEPGPTLVRSIEGADVQRLPLADIRKVALTYQPLSLFDRWVCSVEGGGGRIWAPSASFLAFGRAADQRASFRPFVESLIQVVAAQPSAGGVSYVKGNNWSAYSALALLIVLVVMGVLLALGVAGSMMDGRGLGGASWAILPAVVVSFAARMVWRVWRLNRRQHFDPNGLPPNFAPALQAARSHP